jgi:lipid-binding SYLF domain-containing protein
MRPNPYQGRLPGFIDVGAIRALTSTSSSASQISRIDRKGVTVRLIRVAALGLFAGLVLEGATLRQDLDDNATLYGRKLGNRQIITTRVRTPAAAAKLIAVFNSHAARERGSTAPSDRALNRTEEKG